MLANQTQELIQLETNTARQKKFLFLKKKKKKTCYL